jgi:hypothetical protein
VLGAKLASGLRRRAAFAAPPPRVQDHQYLASKFQERERARSLPSKKVHTLRNGKENRYIHCSVEYEVCVSVCEGSKEGRKKKLLFSWKEAQAHHPYLLFYFFLTHHQEKK